MANILKSGRQSKSNVNANEASKTKIYNWDGMQSEEEYNKVNKKDKQERDREEAAAECESRPNKATTAASARELNGAQQVRLSLLFVARFLFLFFWLFTFPVLRFALTFVIYFAVDLPTDTHTQTHTYTSTHVVCHSFRCYSYCWCCWPTGHYSLRLAEAYLAGPARPRLVLHLCVCVSHFGLFGL